jgi:peptidoglycan/xylan/chitin deacetylase (PgdA/CDA1 family)
MPETAGAKHDNARPEPGRRGVVPILCYHAVQGPERLPSGDADWALTVEQFRSHLDLLVSRGFATLTISELVDARRAVASGGTPTVDLDLAVAITFDDGYADLHRTIGPMLVERGFRATAFVATANVLDRERQRRGGARWLSWAELRDLPGLGYEIGAHGHAHLPLDLLPAREASEDVVRARGLLTDQLGAPVRTMAFPFGYSTRALRRALPALGFDAACGVHHALSGPGDDPFDLARLAVHGTTTAADLEHWLGGDGLRVGPCRERPRTTLARLRPRAKRFVSDLARLSR